MSDAPSLFDAPAARRSDPPTSLLAAVTVAQGNAPLVVVIRSVVIGAGRPVTQFEIAAAVLTFTDRWSEATIRSGCARARLTVVDQGGRSPQGQPCQRYTIGESA
jgi:hypothetical protein